MPNRTRCPQMSGQCPVLLSGFRLSLPAPENAFILKASERRIKCLIYICLRVTTTVAPWACGRFMGSEARTKSVLYLTERATKTDGSQQRGPCCRSAVHALTLRCFSMTDMEGGEHPVRLRHCIRGNRDIRHSRLAHRATHCPACRHDATDGTRHAADTSSPEPPVGHRGPAIRSYLLITPRLEHRQTQSNQACWINGF